MLSLIKEIIKRPHPPLVHFSLALFPTSVIFAFAYVWLDDLKWLTFSFACFMLAAFFILPITVTGLLDYFRLTSHGTYAGRRHLLIHLINGLAIFFLSLLTGIYFWFHPPTRFEEIRYFYIFATVLLTVMVFAQGAVAAFMVYQDKLGVDGETR